MKKNNPSDGILVFDRYYGRKPVTAVLVAERLLFCCMLSAFCMLFIFTEYRFDVPLLFVGAVSVLCTLIFSLLFLFVGRRVGIVALATVTGSVIFFAHEYLWERFSYFVDEAMLLVEGRFLFPRGYLLHDERILTSSNELYREGMLLGSFVLCSLFSLLCSLTMKRRIRCIPALVGFVLLCAPRVLSETLELNGWFVPVIIMFAGAMSISMLYKNGLAVIRSGTGVYRRQVKEEEKRFNYNISKSGYFKRIGMRLSFYSKYFTSGVYCMALAAVSIFIGMLFFKEGSCFDYTEVLRLMSDFSGDVGINSSPFDNGTVSEYFSSDENEKERNGLNIISPGNGEAELIKVSFFGGTPIYLRGDIGISFNGTGWSTPVTDNTSWERSGLKDLYRPCEVDVMSALLDVLDKGYTDVIDKTDVTIEYLCDTDVVFLPSYTNDYSYYTDSSFNVYGDSVVRVNKNNSDFISTVQATALSADFNSYTFFSGAELVQLIEKLFEDNNVSVSEFGTIFSSLSSPPNIIHEYAEYVEQTYISVPVTTRRDLRDFIASNEKLSEIQGVMEDTDFSVAYKRYYAATEISEFLSKNYKYTLSGINDSSDPVMEFLTETKQGHCSLYASAMTLMLRSMGIPARYCTGFAVNPLGNGQNTIILKEKNLHAWVEVYLGELGWATFDPTSAAMNASMQNGEQNDRREEQSAESIDIPERDETRSPVQDDQRPDPIVPPVAPEQQTNFSVEMLLLIACVLTALVFVVLIVIRWNNQKKKAEQRIEKMDFPDGRDICERVLAILFCIGVRPAAGVLPQELYKSVDSRLGTNIHEHYGLLEKALFGSSQFTEDEDEASGQILSEVYRAAVNGTTSLYRRYKIRKIILK